MVRYYGKGKKERIKVLKQNILDKSREERSFLVNLERDSAWLRKRKRERMRKGCYDRSRKSRVDGCFTSMTCRKHLYLPDRHGLGIQKLSGN